MQYEDEEAMDDGYEDADEEPELPRGLRFGEGQPINRGGRPRGSPNIATMVRRVAFKRHRVKIDGVVRRKSTVELVVLALRKKAAQGNVRAFKLQQLSLQNFAPRERIRQGVLIVSEEITIEEWIAEYGLEYTNEEVAEKYPYMMRARKRNQELRAETERQFNESKALYNSRASSIRSDSENT